MEITGYLISMATDYKTGTPRFTFAADGPADLSIAEELMEKRLVITAKRWRKRRSLDSNAYFHVLVGKIAEKIGASITEVKNEMIASYGQYDRTGEGLTYIIMLDAIEWQKLDTIHLKPTAATRELDDHKLYRVYHVMRGSHTYDSAEMARLIDGTISEAKELGIETATPAELKRMADLWRARHEKKAD